MQQNTWESATASSLEWFKATRFGLFVHWGLYSVAAGVWQGRQVPYIGEWIQHEELIPRQDYARLADGFTATAFDPQQWVQLARQAGMGYIVLTAKHHEGFALWDSACDPFNAMRSAACGRDLIAELAEACRAGGIRLGLYYSHCVDWREAHAGNLPGDEKEPSRKAGQGRMWGNDWDFPLGDAAGFDSYLRRKVEPQLTELLTGYGDLALIWFDTPTASLQPEQAQRLRDLIKQHQPGCLVGGRIGQGLQDFDSFGDNQIPCAPMTRPAESCMTLNQTWGYKEHDQDWATPSQVIDLLSACTARNANLLLNVGPRADGSFPEGALSTLATVGRWMEMHGQAIHGGHAPSLAWEPTWGELVQTDTTLHALIHDPDCLEIAIPCPDAGIVGMTDATDQPVSWRIEGAKPGWLIAETPPTNDRLPRRLQISCSETPTWTAVPSALSKLRLRLPARAGTSLAGSPWNGGGATGQQITWKISTHAACRMQIRIACGGERYAEWYGGHQITCEIAGKIRTSKLDHGEPEPGRRWQHNPLLRCHLGIFDLPAGTHAIIVTIVSTTGTEPANLPWIDLDPVT